MSSVPGSVPAETNALTAEQPDADALLLKDRVICMASMYSEKSDSWVAPDSFASMTTDEMNTVILTSMLAMFESGAISSSASDIAAFNTMSKSIHCQVCPAETEFNTFSTISKQNADFNTLD